MSLTMSLEEIKRRITEKTAISDAELDAKIKQKMEALSGLVSKEGAAHIVANELGVRLFEQVQGGRMQLKNLIVGMRNLEVVGIVRALYETRSFTRKDGSDGSVGSFLLADETGTVRVVLWNEQSPLLSQLSEGDIVKITNAYVKKNNTGRFEIHLNEKSTLVPNPGGEDVKGLAEKFSSAGEPQRKTIMELREEDRNVGIAGTVIQVFDLRFYEVCPKCNRRIQVREKQFMCPTHGTVEAPSYAFVLNVFLDDGTGEIRVVCFRDQAAMLAEKSTDDLLALREVPQGFEQVKTDLLGKIVKIIGRVSRNEMFDRLEFIAQRVITDVDPDKEIAWLDTEIARLKKEKEAQEESQKPEEKKQPSEEASFSPEEKTAHSVPEKPLPAKKETQKKEPQEPAKEEVIEDLEVEDETIDDLDSEDE
ncbi:hypothetical protein COY95_00460 [Candidatus Woesearchaeota archaeon CG_4_10_14_0_8_um_filter_47_5]|nr:MAG: hypothetical protein COY95_00460 [Candidatus Woesearchaeota archaeon CG_4_10_14_0_8_um_filter_47_5]